MRFRWRYLSSHFPELDGLLLEDAERVMIIATARARGNWRMRLLDQLVRVTFASSFLGILLFFAMDFGQPWRILVALMFMLAFVLTGLRPSLLNWIKRTYFQDAIRQLHQRQEICFHCGYDLRGSVSPECPECGAALTYHSTNEPTLTTADQFALPASLRSDLPTTLPTFRAVETALEHLPAYLQAELLQAIQNRGAQRRQTWLEWALGIGVVVWLCSMGAIFRRWSGMETNVAVGAIAAWIAFGILLGVLLPKLRVRKEKTMRLALAEELIARGLRPAICLKCELDLSDVEADACPECGAPLAPLADPDHKPKPG